MFSAKVRSGQGQMSDCGLAEIVVRFLSLELSILGNSLNTIIHTLHYTP